MKRLVHENIKHIEESAYPFQQFSLGYIHRSEGRDRWIFMHRVHSGIIHNSRSGNI